jgi:acetoin utilization deacetylase AcuC-like enzyme
MTEPLILFTHPACLDHDPGTGHPERPHRLRAVLRALEGSDFAGIRKREAPLAEIDQIARVHDADFVRLILDSVPTEGRVQVDPDTALSPGSGQAALRAAGGACAAVDAVMGGEAKRAFIAVRPPGHHAETARAMGFCLFNNVAIAARHAQAARGAKKVAVVDFDVHHGNGTQEIFERDPSLFFASSHQWPCYPGTGAPDERGVGNVVNVGLAPGSGSVAFRQAWERQILPAVDDFAPDLLVISAGFDAHADDPLAQLELTEDDYAWVTEKLMAIADRHAKGRVVSALEGGYDLRALAASAAAHVRAMMA